MGEGMDRKPGSGARAGRAWLFCAAMAVLAAARPTPWMFAAETQTAQTAKPPVGGKADKPGTHITPEQAKELCSLVDELLKFSSEETGLPIKSQVKRKITSRAE